jgi:hypothetical protein
MTLPARLGGAATGVVWLAFAATLAYNTSWVPANPWIWNCDPYHCWAWRNVAWLADDIGRAAVCLALLALALWPIRTRH